MLCAIMAPRPQGGIPMGKPITPPPDSREPVPSDESVPVKWRGVWAWRALLALILLSLIGGVALSQWVTRDLRNANEQLEQAVDKLRNEADTLGRTVTSLQDQVGDLSSELKQTAKKLPEGHGNLGSARDQVLPRVHSTCLASAATMGGSRPSAGRDTCFLNIVRPHRTPWFISGWRRGIASWGGPQGSALANNCPGLGEVSPLSPGGETSPEPFRGFGAGRTALRKAARHAPDRNKCTPQA